MLTMPTKTQHTDILIIGAGLAGLSAASKLNKLDRGKIKRCIKLNLNNLTKNYNYV